LKGGVLTRPTHPTIHPPTPFTTHPNTQGLTAASATALGACLAAHPTLRTLNLGRNSLGAAGMRALCSARWKALRRLDLFSCDLDAAAIQALAVGPAVGGLTHLTLSDNELGAAAGGALAELLTHATGLHTLELRKTRLEAEGVSALAAALPRAASLATLDLGECRMGVVGCGALAAALRPPAAAGGAAGGGAAAGAAGGTDALCLQRLVLGPGNQLTSDAVQDLADALTERANAAGAVAAAGDLDLDLAGSDLEAPAMHALAHIPGLKTLALFGATLSSDALASLNQALSTRGSSGSAPLAHLRELNLCGCRLEQDALTRLLVAIEAGATTDGALALVEVGANPGADEEAFQAAAGEMRERQPRIDVHWRAADGSSEGAGQVGAGGAALRPACP